MIYDTEKYTFSQKIYLEHIFGMETKCETQTSSNTRPVNPAEHAGCYEAKDVLEAKNKRSRALFHCEYLNS